MFQRTGLAMPKSAFFVCFLLCGNFILSGNTAEQCPKNPLSPTNSISGMVVGAMVGTEKLVEGVVSFFYYLGENSVNQVLGLSSSLETYLSSLALRLQGFVSGLTSGIGGLLTNIYNGSTGTIRLLFDSIIKLENSVQTLLYNQVKSFADFATSGKFTGQIKMAIQSPFKTLSIGLNKAKGAISKLSSTVSNDIKSVVNSVKTSGIPDDIKGILGAPARGVKAFLTSTKTVIQTVKNETSTRFSGYSAQFKNGGVIDKLVAIPSFPVGAAMEVWSFILKISSAAEDGVSIAAKDVVQPFIGPILTERLGTIVVFPMNIIQGFYKSAMNFFSNIEGVIGRVTGGGSVGDQVNMVVKHPITVLKNAWTTIKEELKAFSKATLGVELTEQFANVLSTPEQAISDLLSSITSSDLSMTLHSFISKPMMYLEKAWTKTKMLIGGITKGILGGQWTAKTSEILGKFFSSPLDALSELWTSLSTTVSSLFGQFGASISLSGGGTAGGIKGAISSFLQAPVDVFKGIFSGIEKAGKSLTNSLKGFYENLPIIGNGGSLNVEFKAGDEKAGISFGGGGGGKKDGSGRGFTILGGDASGGGSASSGGFSSGGVSGGRSRKTNSGRVSSGGGFAGHGEVASGKRRKRSSGGVSSGGGSASGGGVSSGGGSASDGGVSSGGGTATGGGVSSGGGSASGGGVSSGGAIAGPGEVASGRRRKRNSVSVK